MGWNIVSDPFFYLCFMKGFQCNSPLRKPNFSDIFKLLDEVDIFSFYVPNLVLNGVTNSPIGATDNHASFSVFWNPNKSKYMFKEYRYGYVGDCVDLVRYIFSYQNNTKACMRICRDFGITEFRIDKDIEKSTVFTLPSKKKITKLPIKDRKIDISVVTRIWKKYDIDFWKSYGISLKYLKLANIYPIKYYYLGNSLRVADKYAYCYVENKDNIITYKIYQPFNENKQKWINNNNNSIWELWHLLPKNHNFLIITKSRKDALSIIENCKIPSISLQAEGVIPKIQVIEELKERFKNIFLLYDNDYDKEVNWGEKYSEKLSQNFNIPKIVIPSVYKEKDFTDLIKSYNIKIASKIVYNLIKKELIIKNLKK